MAKHNEIGKLGEEKALSYLLGNNFNIIAKNWRVEHLEIDIIAEKDSVIHFVEVKTRKKNSLLHARESLSHTKKLHLEKLVELWYLQNPSITNSAQLDLIAVTYTENKNSEKDFNLEYYPNYTQ